ncbi:MAG: S24 family peptidase [Burkholderiales bacterium]|jgi:SOS-response transcriptional repressor LexA|nr:S24 family peptidase [Burkholderiales bacterium]
MSDKKVIPINPLAEVSHCAGAEPFALMVLDDYMEPEFHHGEIIVCEPEGLARDGAFVVAEHEGEFYFRQLRIRDGVWSLHALNPKYPSFTIAGPSAIRGVVILKKKPGRRREMKRYT